jgi:hypothetical protein
MSLNSFSSFAAFVAVYGSEPHLSCYLLSIYRGYGTGWDMRLVVGGVEVREVRIAVARKSDLAVWCKKSVKIVHWNMRQVIGVGRGSVKAG